MSIATEITRIQTAKSDIKTQIEAKGVTVPSSASLSDYPTYVSQIQGGGGTAEADLINLIERDITSITIPSGVTSIGNYAFGSCSNLTSIDIPNSVTNIGQSVFQNCSGLTSIDIPSGVTSIDTYAFQYCFSLTSVTIGSGVTSIGNSVFRNCVGLTSVTINAATPPTLGSRVFDNTNDCPIYVPSESVETYKAAEGWSTYASRIQAIP